MKNNLPALALAAAGLVFGVAAQAAGGVTISHAQEMNIRVGMTADEVRAALGRPAENQNLVGGLVWTYNVVGAPTQLAEFEVNFGPDGKVASVAETEVEVE